MKAVISVLILIFSLHAAAKKQLDVYDGFWKNTRESFTTNIPWHLSAIGLTPVLISTGADAHVHQAFQGYEGDWFQVGEAAGYLAPFAIAVPLYAYGKSYKNKRTTGASYAVIQTSIIALTTVSVLKSFTGRPPPDRGSSQSIQKQSREFNFGFLNRGIYDGWPSGHMATMTSIASTLIHYYPEKTWLKWAGYFSMAYMMATVTMEEHAEFHWLSDGVAGGLMGYAIGKTVGTNMRADVMGTPPPVEEKTVDVLPIFGPGKSGIQIVWIQ